MTKIEKEKRKSRHIDKVKKSGYLMHVKPAQDSFDSKTHITSSIDFKNGCVFHRYHPDQMAIAAAAPGPSVSSYVPGWLA